MCIRDSFKDVPHFASKLAIESALREFDVPFTIIRPNYFIQNDATLKDPLMKAGIYPAPLGNVGISVVDIRDIAEATAIVLTSEEHNGKTYNLNGPEAVSGPKAASIWSRLLGKEIRYTGHDMDAFEAVSYTHLDVYKRQVSASLARNRAMCAARLKDARTWKQKYPPFRSESAKDAPGSHLNALRPRQR